MGFLQERPDDLAQFPGPVADAVSVSRPDGFDCLEAFVTAAISCVALDVWVASSMTSEATTANPRPASPARAASIVAFSNDPDHGLQRCRKMTKPDAGVTCKVLD